MPEPTPDGEGHDGAGAPGVVTFPDPAALAAAVGRTVVMSDWRPLAQGDIDAFATLTGDQQWIHTDPDRAARESPYGRPVAHAFLSLALLSGELQNRVQVGGIRLGLIYGLNKVRFPAPLPVDSDIRTAIALLAFQAVAGGVEATWQVTVVRQGEPKPVCVAEVVVRYLT